MKLLKSVKIVYVTLFIITLLVGSYFVAKYVHISKIKPSYINYQEKNSVDYKVYLKENDFFEEPYLEEGKAYITTLIDYLDITFNNKVSFADKTSGSYTYYVKGTILATKPEESNVKYWEKEYILSDVKTVNYLDETNITNSNSVNIDYQKYNDLLLEFRQNYKIAFDGSLLIELVFENNIVKEGQTFSEKSISSLSIPLTQATIEVPVLLDETERTKTLELKNDNEETLVRYKTAVTIYIGVLAFEVFMLSFRTRKIKDKNSYEEKLKRIMKEYDYIMVNLNTPINLRDMNVIEVSEFSELIDAHSEVRQPINCKQYKSKTEFVLINDKVAWRYVLEENGAHYEKEKVRI